MSWDELRKAAPNKYLKLKDGESTDVVFAGEPYLFFKDKDYKSKAEHAEWAEGRSFRFRINVITKTDDGDLKVKVFENGTKFKNQLLTAIDECGLDSSFKIKRVGSTKEDTSYVLFPKGKITEETKAKIATLKLYDLSPHKGESFSDEFSHESDPDFI